MNREYMISDERKAVLDAGPFANISPDRERPVKLKVEPMAVRPLDDDQIMEIIKEVAPWKDEPKLNDLLTYEKSVPLFPQATYDVPSYRATNFVRAVEARVRSALNRPAGERPAVVPEVMGDDDTERTWRNDPSADERWNAGLDYGQTQLCKLLGVDPASVRWDAATETLDGDVQAVIGNILTACFGDEWRITLTAQAGPCPALPLNDAELIDGIDPVYGDGRSLMVDP